MANELIKVKATISYNGKSYSKDNSSNLTVVDSSLTTTYVYGISATKTFSTDKQLTMVTGGTAYINIRPTNGVSNDTYSLTSSNTTVANTVTSATWVSGDLSVAIPIKANGTVTFTIKNTKTNQTVGTVTITAITPKVFANVSADPTTIGTGVKTITSGLTHHLQISVDNDILGTVYSFAFISLPSEVQDFTNMKAHNYQGGIISFPIRLNSSQTKTLITVSVRRLGIEVYRFTFWLDPAKLWVCVKPENDTTTLTSSDLTGTDKLFVGTAATTKYNLFVYWDRPVETHPTAQYTVVLYEEVNGTFTSYKSVVIAAKQNQGRVLVTLPASARTDGATVTYSIDSITSSTGENIVGFIKQQSATVKVYASQYGATYLKTGKGRTGSDFSTFGNVGRLSGYTSIYVNYMKPGDTIAIDTQHNYWQFQVEDYPSELFIVSGTTLQAKVACGGFWVEWRIALKGLANKDSDLRFWANGVYFTKINIWVAYVTWW